METLEETLGAVVTPRTQARGRRYADAGRVEVTEVSGGRVHALVHGTETYDTFFESRAKGWSGWCSCPAFDTTGPCKHIWALILVCDRQGLVGRALNEPGGRLGAGPGRALLRPEPRVPTWRERMGQIGRGAPHDRDPWSETGLDRRVVYALNVERTLEGRGPVVEVFRQTRLVSGDWGGPSRYRGRGGADVPAEDRDLVRRVLAVDSWRLYGSGAMGLAEEALFPALCATGRFFLMRQLEIGSEPLALDAGGPWAFGLAFDREGKECVVRGYLERGDERVPIENPALLLASGWAVFARAAARLDARGAMDLIVELRQGGPIRVPLKEERAAFESVVSLPSRPLLSGPGVPPIVTDAPRPHLRLKSDPYGDPSCRVEFGYGTARVRATDRAATVLAKGHVALRDFDAEGAWLRRLLDRGAVLRGSTPVVPARRLPQTVRALLADGWHVEADGKPYRAGGAFRASVRSGIDWFELEGAMDFEGQAVALPALLEAARTGTVVLGDGSVGIVPEDWLARWGFLGKSGTKFTNAQGFFLDALLADRPEVDVDGRFAELRQRLASFEGIRPREESGGFRGTLRPYQREGLGWFTFLREMGLGGCLADDMGLGKTVQVLALLQERRGSKPSLVVAPKSVVSNWILEARKFAPQLRALDYTGAARKDRVIEGWDLVVTTYGTLRRDAAELSDVSFDYAILDEAQMIKNPRAACAKAARLIRADHRLALTGTPVENHLGDLWSILDFLNPGMAPRVEAFRELGDDVLKRALRPFFLRRTKEQVLSDLPEKSEQVLYCDLDGKQRKAYDEIRDHYRASLLARATNGGLARMKIHVLEALLRLRQTACHHGLVDPARAGEPCAKLDTLLPLLEEVIAEGHKALVFSQFTSFLAILRRELDARGIGYEYLDGQTRRREKVVERFQSAPADKCPLFLISLKAGGFGLNLTAADYVFLLDPWWNPAVEMQAIDRTHRIGQERKVMAYRIIGRGTVEERVLELQASKRALAEAVLTADRTLLESLTREDLELLLS